jgi:hypothetical protein
VTGSAGLSSLASARGIDARLSVCRGRPPAAVRSCLAARPARGVRRVRRVHRGAPGAPGAPRDLDCVTGCPRGTLIAQSRLPETASVARPAPRSGPAAPGPGSGPCAAPRAGDGGAGGCRGRRAPRPGRTRSVPVACSPAPGRCWRPVPAPGGAPSPVPPRTATGTAPPQPPPPLCDTVSGCVRTWERIGRVVYLVGCFGRVACGPLRRGLNRSGIGWPFSGMDSGMPAAAA